MNSLTKGVLLVGTGAASYGILATLVGLAYKEGYTTTEVVTSQYIIGLLAIGILLLFSNKKTNNTPDRTAKYDVTKLIAGGTTFGLTGFFYYLSVKYIPVSVGVVLLMQAIWMGIIAEALLTRKFPDFQKCVAVVLVLFGTLLATNAIVSLSSLNMQGLVYGLLAALMYTLMLLVTNKVANSMNAKRKSFYLLLGAVITVVGVGLFTMPDYYHLDIFYKWGLLVAIFGTILPPLLFNKGMPLTGMGLGSIIISIEIPVSVTMAYLLLDEKVNALQWLGIAIIIGSVVIINLKELKKNRQAVT